MELQEAIQKRRSVRNFTDEKIDKADIEKLIESAAMAPSVNNLQPWKFIVIANPALINDIAEMVEKTINNLPGKEKANDERVRKSASWYATFFKSAPVLIAIALENYETTIQHATHTSQEEIYTSRFYPDLQAVGASVQNILLSATEMGYASCWVSAPLVAKSKIERFLVLDKDYQIVSFVALGKTDQMPAMPEKKEVENLFEFIE